MFSNRSRFAGASELWKWFVRPISPRDGHLLSTDKYHALEARLEKLRVPQDRVEEVEILICRFARYKLISFYILISASIIGIFYLVRPGDAFKFIANIVIYTLPWIWLGAIYGNLAYRGLKQDAVDLHATWKHIDRPRQPDTDAQET
jgi:hypothetical protein